jgi:hypothetical protein
MTRICFLISAIREIRGQNAVAKFSSRAGTILKDTDRLKISLRIWTHSEPIGPQWTQLPNDFLGGDSIGPFWPHFRRRGIQRGIQWRERKLSRMDENVATVQWCYLDYVLASFVYIWNTQGGAKFTASTVGWDDRDALNYPRTVALTEAYPPTLKPTPRRKRRLTPCSLELRSRQSGFANYLIETWKVIEPPAKPVA